MPVAVHRAYETCLNLQALAERLVAQCQPLVWLDSARPHRLTGRWSLVGWDPWLSCSASGSRVTLTTSAGTTREKANPLDVLRAVLQRYAGLRHTSDAPIRLGLLGFLGYGLNQWIERLPAPKPTDVAVPDLLMYGMRQLVVVDHAARRSWFISLADPHQPADRAWRQAHESCEAFQAWLPALTTPEESLLPSSESWDLAPEPAMSQRQFEEMVLRAQEFIGAGEIFQANLSQRFTAPWTGSSWNLYRALRQINPSPFACFLSSPECAVVSCSPERLVRVADGIVSTRPIAGTRPRGANPQEDLVNSLELILSDKERAEHIMLVDLARNDLGRVCRYGSVRVNELMALEDYSHVIHIVSNIEGLLQDGVEAVEVIRALFPGGTITGCPKVRCMEILHELEPVGRGLYTGSLGLIGFDGSLDLNILIRTIVTDARSLSFHVGAGIVADSQPEREYHETLAKAGALFSALQAARVPQRRDERVRIS